MRFFFDYKDYNDKSAKNRTLTLLCTFLNFHLVEIFHGWTYECLFIDFRNNSPINKTNTAKKHYNIFAKIEINGVFENNRDLNLHDFTEGFRLVLESVVLVDEIPNQSKDYHIEKLIKDLTALKDLLPKTTEDLLFLSKQRQIMDGAFQLKRVNGHFQATKEYPLPLKKRLGGMRIYPKFKSDILMPYVYIYNEIFSTLLRNENILTPYYQEIYISIAGTLEEAKQSGDFMIYEFYKYTYAGIDIDKFDHYSEAEKKNAVFQSICDGLRLIADADHLDKEKIENVIKRVEAEGLDILLTYTSTENSHYKADVLYRLLPDHKELVPFYLQLTDKKNNRSNTVLINKFRLWWAAYSFGKTIIKKDEIIIKGKGGLRGEVSRKSEKLPEEHRFMIATVLDSVSAL